MRTQQLNIMDLHRNITAKKNRINESFEKVLKIIHKKIVSHANQQKLACLVEVPTYVYGCPIYDYNVCVEYVFESLQKNGFFVKYFFPKFIYVSWDFDEINQAKKTEIANNKLRDMYSLECLMAQASRPPAPIAAEKQQSNGDKSRGLEYKPSRERRSIERRSMNLSAKPSGKLTLDLG
jgi:hypothetical protein